MPFCPGCGSEIEEKANFCTNCGLKISEEIQDQEIIKKSRSKFSFGRFIFNLVITIIAIALLCLVWYLSKTAF